MPISKPDVVQLFTDRFGGPPSVVVRAPGRVNLIGEHTDYNDGFVMPLAIDRAVWIALRPREDRRVEVYSAEFEQAGGFSLESFHRDGEGWLEYLKGTAWSLIDAGHSLRGFEGVVTGDVPRGAGLSSSAALEMATARALCAVSDCPWDPAVMAKLAQRAENRWVGVNCGIMDQLISGCGKRDHAVLIDCRTLALEPVPLPAGAAVVILDTATRRGLVDSAYNERRACCEEAARFFQVRALRDISAEQLAAEGNRLDATTQRRAGHVVRENERTKSAAQAMRCGNAEVLGRLMVDSHVSLRDDYEVSSDALNAIVDCANEHPACFGARMTGAGFGGCAVALVRAETAQDFVSAIGDAYHAKTGLAATAYVCQATDGADVV
ncbi:MAG: galactokinase [Planctomycetota bacterium]